MGLHEGTEQHAAIKESTEGLQSNIKHIKTKWQHLTAWLGETAVHHPGHQLPPMLVRAPSSNNTTDLCWGRNEASSPPQVRKHVKIQPAELEQPV